ncbi:MAG: hypothetical protein Q8934_21405 [Bacillota bacterium]|nr:hypothetical protein [Bacillota bacterium]
MDASDYFLLVIAVIYFLFNIKKVYTFFRYSFNENGVIFTLGLILFVSICILGLIFAFTAPQYGWIPQWAFILFIVGFFVCRFLFGIPK